MVAVVTERLSFITCVSAYPRIAISKRVKEGDKIFINVEPVMQNNFFYHGLDFVNPNFRRKLVL